MDGFNYTSIFSGAKDEVLNALAGAAPAAGAIFGIVLAIGIGMKVYKKVSSKG